MQKRKRKLLSYFNLLLVLVLLLFSSRMILLYENPESMIEGEWNEVGWYFEKVDEDTYFSKYSKIKEELKQEVIQDLAPLKDGKWHFVRSELKNYLSHHDTIKYGWYIKGRGHVLELRKDDVLVESFIIQEISNDKMVLHLNLDLQTKGIAKIVLKREEMNKYAKKI